MTRRAVAAIAALALAASVLVAGARGASPAPAAGPEQPPAGTVLILIAQSDGLTWLPVGQGIVPPTACQP